MLTDDIAVGSTIGIERKTIYDIGKRTFTVGVANSGKNISLDCNVRRTDRCLYDFTVLHEFERESILEDLRDD